MTLPPLDSWNVRPAPGGPKYKVGPRCCNPSCRRIAEHAHHMWRRSFLGGDFAWVELPDGQVIGNLVPLCADCHDDVTGRLGGHKAAIRLGVNDNRFWWCRTAGENGATTYDPVDPIDPQPPTRESLVASPARAESESCPTCGQPKPARRSSTEPHPHGERRRRKSWTIPVPADSEEDGAWVLDTLTDDLAPLLGLHPNKQGRWTTARYYVVVPALYFVQQHREEFLKEIVG